ncbi:hypothetical protein SAMN05428989_4092 [Pseudoxanthomonas sp. GM95]|uniref:hypothetical protein n=1 Tax=Pseudoxanthomonas sp. GM95 TaxID=1881043 RepID=UPI0008AB63F0|nr:hypothetical protein [Pseudoxanthomonas sp. GM95]SEM57543.1 hypothetical protein SAMN05428989_4092 [Pseudoxanthomonas sp. GM95]
MRHAAGLLLLALVVLPVSSVFAWQSAQADAPVPAGPPAPPPYDANSGDAWIDARLKDLNAYAPRYPDAFVDEIARYLDVPRGYVVALGQQPGWSPGDVYYACALGKVLAQPCRVVVRARSQDAEDGWKGVASRVAGTGKPIPTRALRELLRTSYAHWDRPLN